MHYIGLRNAKGKLMQTDQRPVLWPSLEAATEANKKMGDKYTPVVVTLIVTGLSKPEPIPGIPEGAKWVEVDPRDFVVEGSQVSGKIYIANTTHADFVIDCEKDNISTCLTTAVTISLGISGRVQEFLDDLYATVKPGNPPFFVYTIDNSVVIKDGETVLTHAIL
jgi:hypothetical protein